VAVSEVGVESVEVSLVVVYVRKDSVIRVVTVYPFWGKLIGRWVLEDG